MNEELIEQIRVTMEQRSTEELLRIWQENDRQEWSAEAFTAILHILDARGESPGLQAQAASTDEPAQTSRRERPGCITAAAILLSVIAVAAVISAILSVLVTRDDGSIVGMLTTGILAGVYFLVARGLWQLKNWARITFIVLNGLGILLTIAILISLQSLLLGVVGLVISGYVIYWFASHGEYFH